MSENAYAHICIDAPIILAKRQFPSNSFNCKSEAQVPTTTSVKSHPNGNLLNCIPNFIVSSSDNSEIASTTLTTSLSILDNSIAAASS